jgi:FKBP-type peptidyl-prolyl cis-trans isomerase
VPIPSTSSCSPPVLDEGEGPSGLSPTVTGSCSVHYQGTLIDGTPFDSSYERGEPSEVAPNQVIKGWTEALQYMTEGEKWEVYIPMEMAYGRLYESFKVSRCTDINTTKNRISLN